jgi:pilus assembly protein TadC
LEPLRAILFIFGGYFIGYFIATRGYQRARQRYVRELEFHLPLVMERLVMAVHAGLDVLAAIRAILQHEQAAGRPLSPVSERLQQVLRYTESGLGFDEALRLISDQTPCPALRHAFLHLGTAYREGGELVMPLRELSDATQLYYQETLEEEVAAMPVKATVPLVITFAGLIMIFVAMPLVQVMSMMKRSMPEQTHEIR